MSPNQRRLRLLALVLGGGIAACGGSDPVAPANQRPVILSMSVFPTTIGSMDSAVVICNATDPDADSLVYDWITDSRLRIQGAPGSGHSLFNTRDNFRVVYPDFIVAPVDSPWIQCFARDGKGQSDNRIIEVIVRQ